MHNRFCRYTVFAVGLFGAVAVASAQGGPKQDAPKQDGADVSQDNGPGGSLPGPNATQPQANSQSTDGSTAVQPVPGAMPDSDTVPSTISAKHAADDKLITLAYTFKNLTDEQRQAIRDVLKMQPPGAAFNADIGTALPVAVEMHALPEEVVKRVPQTQGYRFAKSDDRVLLISPATRVVVGVIADAKSATTGQGSSR